MYSDLKQKIKQVLDSAENDINTSYPQWMYDDILKVCDEYEQQMKGCVCWCAEDVQERARQIGYEVPTDEEAQEILEEVIDAHDCNYGITWEHFDWKLTPKKGNN